MLGVVPWNPDRSEAAVPDHRLDPYRDRGALVRLGDQEVMRIYVQVDALWTQTSGHLWWRRWSKPREFVILHMFLVDGVKGHWFLPGGGRGTCPVTVTRSAR